MSDLSYVEGHRRRTVKRQAVLIEALWGERGAPATAEHLAEVCDVTKRTIYRDLRELIDAGLPIRGEAGVGYHVDASARLPGVELTFDQAVWVALVLVEQHVADKHPLDEAQLRSLRGRLFETHPSVRHAIETVAGWRVFLGRAQS